MCVGKVVTNQIDIRVYIIDRLNHVILYVSLLALLNWFSAKCKGVNNTSSLQLC